MKVAQIARTIADVLNANFADDVQHLGGIDSDAAEAAGLAHDLGHPPFGHIAEEELDRLVREAGVTDGFEGNAQSFRIVCRLAVSDAQTKHKDTVNPVAGLNLTQQTLAGLLKYPWPYGGNPHKLTKWGFYQSERTHFEWARTGVPQEGTTEKTLVAEVMDWADDVTYALHDLLDFYRAGLIPLELVRQPATGGSAEREKFLASMFERKTKWLARRTAYENALDQILEMLPFDVSHKYAGTVAEDQVLYQFSTTLISRFVLAIQPNRSGPSAVKVPDEVRDQVEVLKQFIWHYVILNPALAQVQVGQRHAIERVFLVSLRASLNGDRHFFPEPHRSTLETAVNDEDRVRLAADYVAGLTERELLAAHRRFTGRQ